MTNTPPSVGTQFITPGHLQSGLDISQAYGAKAWYCGGAANRRPSFRVSYSGSYAFANNTSDGIISGTPSGLTINEDTDGGFNLYTGKYTVITDGYWMFMASAIWNNSGNNTKIRLNDQDPFNYPNGVSNWCGPGQLRNHASWITYVYKGFNIWPSHSTFGGSTSSAVTNMFFSGYMIGQ